MIEITINHTVAFENMLQAAPVFLCPPSIEINPFKKSYEFSPIKYFDNWSKRTTNATTTQKVTTNLTLTLIFFIKNNYTFSKTFVNKLWVDCSVVASITIINLAQHIIHANTKQFYNEHKFVNSRLRDPFTPSFNQLFAHSRPPAPMNKTMGCFSIKTYYKKFFLQELWHSLP